MIGRFDFVLPFGQARTAALDVLGFARRAGADLNRTIRAELEVNEDRVASLLRDLKSARSTDMIDQLSKALTALIEYAKGLQAAYVSASPAIVAASRIQSLDSSLRDHIVNELSRLLRAFHEANERNPNGFESVSWRGQLGGFRHGIRLAFGDRMASEILEAVRDKTKLGFPHIGPVLDNGDIQGFDSEAQPGL